MEHPWVISVLSTDYDLHEYRKAVIDYLLLKKICVSAFELPDFPVEPNIHSHDSCLVALGRTDIVLLIIGKRYGGTYYGSSEDDSLSITEEEFIKSIKDGKPVFVFVNKASFDELHTYKEGYKNFISTPENAGKKEDELIANYDKNYICSYVESVKTLQFINKIQKSFAKFGNSNWMSFFTDIPNLINSIEGKLKGHSRYLLQCLANKQEDSVLNRHSSTSIGMSLRDVFSSSYYIEAPHVIESGKGLVKDGLELSDTIDNILKQKQSVLIYGEAGYGKSTIIAKCFSKRVSQATKSSSYKIPMFLSLRNKGSKYGFTIKEYLDDELSERMGKQPYPFLDWSTIGFVFYCDGFDELAESMTEEDVDRIRETEIFKYNIVLTCRQQYVTRYLKVHSFSDIFGVRIKMQKWDKATIIKYVSNYFEKKGTEDALRDNVISKLKTDIDFQQLVDSPLSASMLLSYAESNGKIDDLSRVDLFKYWVDELAQREHSSKGIPSLDIIKVWEYVAWLLYMCRIKNEELSEEDLNDFLSENDIVTNPEAALSTLDSLFERKSNFVVGSFHEQFMEYLVANLLVKSCIDKKDPYPDFLTYVLRPEINRYFRSIWIKLSRKNKTASYEAIRAQYIENLDNKSNDSVEIRVHAAYFICRLNCDLRDETIKRAFKLEEHISVRLSLYFGAIKLGDLDKEEELYTLLNNNEESSKANRGYHLVYYADMIPKGTMPYWDDYSTWDGTLKAIEKHFENNDKYFFVQRIDLFTIRSLILSRNKADPLSEKSLQKIKTSIDNCKLSIRKEYKEYYDKLLNEYNLLYRTFKKYS